MDSNLTFAEEEKINAILMSYIQPEKSGGRTEAARIIHFFLLFSRILLPHVSDIEN